MRSSPVTLVTRVLASLAILLAMTAAGWAQNVGQGGVGGNGRHRGLNLDAMAQLIFNTADHNHNGILSRTEFSTAQLLTESAVANLGRNGLLGRRPSLVRTGPLPQPMVAGPLGHGGMLAQAGRCGRPAGCSARKSPTPTM